MEAELVPEATVWISGMWACSHDQGVVRLQGDHCIREQVVLLDVGESLVTHRAVVIAEARTLCATQTLHVRSDVHNVSAVVIGVSPIAL